MMAESDLVFGLGWLKNPDLARRGLGVLAGKAKEYTVHVGVYESDTQAIFVEPVLRALNWETLDHNQVDREPPGGRTWDISLWSYGKRVVALEVKKFHSAEDAYGQLRGYVLDLFAGPDPRGEIVRSADGRPQLCGVVTNGVTWTVFDFDDDRLVPARHERACQWQLGSGDVGSLIAAIGRSALLVRLGLVPE